MIAALMLCCIQVYAQTMPAGIDTSQYARSMSEVTGQRSDGMNRYFENGISQPFEGILYATYDNGNFKSWQEFQKGIGEGHWINFYENGNMSEWGTYEQSKVQGPIRKYYESGVLKSEGIYRDWRVRIGVWKYYNRDGELVKTEDYGTLGDFRDVEAYYQSGQISERWYQSIIESNQKYSK